jgi:hypothetical protein
MSIPHSQGVLFELLIDSMMNLLTIHEFIATKLVNVMIAIWLELGDHKSQFRLHVIRVQHLLVKPSLK